ncbi:MAG: alpha-1,4-glucan--maltose-1-phosphate maltosyltransferase [Acidimicrobiia bacterium]
MTGFTDIEPTTRRVVIENIAPTVDCGRFPAKRIVGDEVTVEADVFADGHDHVAAVIEFRAGAGEWRIAPMSQTVMDRLQGSFRTDEVGGYEFRVRGWIDHFDTWRDGLEKKDGVGQDVSVDLQIGAELVDAAASRAEGAASTTLTSFSSRIRQAGSTQPERVAAALDPDLAALMSEWGDRTRSTVSDAYPIRVDRQRARFSSWYELFPRSWGPTGEHGTFAHVTAKLPYVAEMGFDVLYLPPIHPIGTTKRKGPNNSLDVDPDDPGVPWAVGSSEGGHLAIHPELGTLADFQTLRAEAKSLGIELAMDVAFQCSPDHPWVSEHPEWFKHRPDGSIQYAENPPKRYEDIYPIDFETSDPQGLWAALRDVFLYWSDQGVEIFRVDNPHTKAFPFWEWVIAEVSARHPNAIFLAEAFTRPTVMHRLAKLGFTQSYTYFTWRNTVWELQSYVEDLLAVADVLRPNFWPNTPDILSEYLQTGGRPAFVTRVILAATLSSNYGIYGPEFELMGSIPRSAGSEEYRDSEKYQIREWDLERPESLAPLIGRLNQIRRSHPALQRSDNIRFHQTDNPEILCFSKEWKDDLVLVVVNLDPHHTQSGHVEIPVDEFGIDEHHSFQVHDELVARRYLWNERWNYVELDPEGIPAHVFAIRRLARTEHDFDYYL